MGLESILGVVVTALGAGLVWLWKKYGGLVKNNEIVKLLVEKLKDGELTEEEAKEVLEEVVKLLEKKKKKKE